MGVDVNAPDIVLYGASPSSSPLADLELAEDRVTIETQLNRHQHPLWSVLSLNLHSLRFGLPVPIKDPRRSQRDGVLFRGQLVHCDNGIGLFSGRGGISEREAVCIDGYLNVFQ